MEEAHFLVDQWYAYSGLFLSTIKGHSPFSLDYKSLPDIDEDPGLQFSNERKQI